MKYKLIVLDLDGTLTNSKKEITPRNRETLIRIQEQGIRLVLASGRPTYGIVPLANELRMNEFGGFILSYNGGEIINWETKEMVYENVLPNEVVPMLYECARTHQLSILTYDGADIITENSQDPYVQKEAFLNKMAVRETNDFLTEITLPVAKCLIVGDADKLIPLEAELSLRLQGHINVFRSEPYFLELVPQGIDKALSLAVLLKEIGVAREEVIAMGDGYNDLSMIKFAGLGIAMGNAQEPVKKAAGHRILALNRGEDEKILTVKVAAPTEQILGYLEKQVITKENPYTTPVLKAVTQDSYSRLIAPSVDREIRSELTDKAQEGAIRVFGKNLEQLLMQPPIAGKVVLGWDPAFRTGCKLAVVDSTGKVLDTVVIFPTAPQNKVAESKKILKDLIHKYGISLISVGNGTASRESEQIIVELLKELKEQVQYVIVNEAGASVYSASKLATEEFPKFDVGQRSAVSIARRLQDPLAELVKIDPKSIGVGQYQHDMNQKNLGEALGGVVEDCVNKVGVDLNTASASLLEYVSGINKTLAKNIVAYREENGAFKNRKQLLKVAKLGPKAFEQCAGFMRITGGDNPLDGTSVHPESYEAAGKLLEKLGYTEDQLSHGGLNGISKKIGDYKKMAQEMGVGEITLRDITAELEKPARDPRDEMPRPVLRSDIMEMKDLKPGMVLKGTVRNVIDFGAFVDIGVHQDGLVHISQMTDRYIKHPLEAVSVGDVVDVKILSVDMDKKRIALTMKGVKDGN